MNCSGTIAALQAAQENPRCLRCDKMLPEYHKGDPLDCGCELPDIKDAEDDDELAKADS